MPLIAAKPLSVAYRGYALIFLKFFWKFGRQIGYKAFAGARTMQMSPVENRRSITSRSVATQAGIGRT